MEDWNSTLKNNGWAVLNCPIAEDFSCFIGNISKKLGMPALGRKGAVMERLQPVGNENAHPQSLSNRYGFTALPLHNDTAHWLIPCRYIVLGCEEPGEILSPTVLLDTDSLVLTEQELCCINTASFFVKNGRKSFYSSIRSKDRPFFRFDPGCMQPVSADGKKAMNSLIADRHADNMIEIEWKKNKVVIIDNWRMLHGRGNKKPADPRRILLRIMVR